MAEILALGQVTVDDLFIIPHMPEIDGSVFAEKKFKQQGGMATTAIKTISKLGLEVEFVGGIGDDTNGTFVLNEFKKAGVNISQLQIFKEGSTANSVILVDQKTGKRTIINSPGVQRSNYKLSVPDLAKAKFLHLDGSWIDTAVETALLAKEKNISIILDISPNNFNKKVYKLLKLADYVVVSEKFLESHFEENLVAASRNILADGAKAVVVTKGEKGSLLFTEKVELEFETFKTSIVDTTGAGDSFHGGFIYGLSQGYSLEKTVIFASAVAALNCRCLGGQTGLPTIVEVNKFLNENNINTRKRELKNELNKYS